MRMFLIEFCLKLKISRKTWSKSKPKKIKCKRKLKNPKQPKKACFIKAGDALRPFSFLKFLYPPYNQTHGLLGIKDPLGDTPIRNDYDANGRLTDSIDAFGNKITYNYNLATNSEAVTNRLNQPTVYVYDNNGNVIKSTDALGNVTTYTYSTDGYNNKLSELLPGNSAPTVYQYNDPNNPQLVTQQTDPMGFTTSYTYDPKGHVLTSTDGRQITTSNTYDSYGNLNASQVQGFPPTQYSYDANGNMIQETDPLGIVTSNSYDPSGNLISTTVASGTSASQTTTYTYDGNGNRLTQTQTSSAGNLVTSYSYDSSNRLVMTTYPDGTNTKTVYDSLGHTIGTIDQKQRQISTFYDSMGRPVTIEQPDNRKSVYEYDANGNRIEDTEYGTDGTNRSTGTVYDQINRAVTVNYPDGTHTASVYDPQSRVTDSFDENNNDTHSVYDQDSRKTTVVAGYSSAVAQETDFTYDNDGNQATMRDANGHTTGYSYDNLNRQTQVNFIDGTFTMTTYDNDGRKLSFRDQAGLTTQYAYDGQGRLTQVTDALGQNTSYSYDELGNQLSQTDANGHTTSYTYDAMNRRKSRTLPDGRTQSYSTYDATGNLTNYTDLAGNAFTNSYSPLDDKLTGVTGPGVSEAYTYDSFLRRHSFTDATGTTTFNYDERDRMVGQSGPAGLGTLTFTYLPSGQINKVESSNTNGNNLTYEYDSLNRPATILDGAKTTTISYDQVSNLAVINLPNGAAVTQTYDSLNRMTGINVAGTGGTLGSYQYTLGAAGNRVNVQEYNGRAVSIVNDDLYRLTNEIITGDPASNNGAIGYVYDNTGNRDQRTSFVTPIPTQTFTGGYNPADELKSTFNFDGNGNQLSDAQSRTYTYNNFSQLTRVQGSGLDVAYVYDGDGLRVKKTNNLTGVTTNYLWDRNNLTGYPQVSEELQNGQVVRRYVYGPAGPLYMSQLVGGNWVNSYFGKDAQNVRFLMNDSGQISDAYTWDAFGNLLSSTGAGTANNTGAFGEYTDTDTGLIYLRARWMNPTLGRFMQMDTYEGDPEDPLSLSKYQFVSNDPSDMVDPGGHDGDIADVASEGTTPLITRSSVQVKLEDLPSNITYDQLIAIMMGEAHGGAAGGGDNAFEKQAMIASFSNLAYNNQVLLSKHPNASGRFVSIRPTSIIGVIRQHGSTNSSYNGADWHKIMISDDTPHTMDQINNTLVGSDRMHYNDIVDSVNGFSGIWGLAQGWISLPMPNGELAPIGYNHSTSISPNPSAPKGTYQSAGMINGTGFWAYGDNQPGHY